MAGLADWLAALTGCAQDTGAPKSIYLSEVAMEALGKQGIVYRDKVGKY
jgi:hypothetical protein